MQSALVPEIAGRIGALAVSVAYRPADGPAAGGDFYDAFALDEDRVAIILGDVSGHGRAALAHATHMHYMLRAYMEAGLGPRASLKLAGQVLGPAEDDLFTTVAAAIYDASSGSLTYATAGHPPPLTGGSTTYEPLPGCASPALGWGAPTGRRQTTIPFPDGAWACFFSDGLTEARRDRRLLGRDGLAQLLRDGHAAPSAQSLLGEVRAHAEEIRDDMAACIIAPVAGRTVRDTIIEELEIQSGELEPQASRFLTACRVAPHEIPPMIERAGAVADEHGLVLLSVEIDPASSRAGISPSVATPPSAEFAVNGVDSTHRTGVERPAAVAHPPARSLASRA